MLEKKLKKGRQSRMENAKTARRAPLMFRVANRLLKARVRGSSRLMRALTDRGVLDVVVHYRLGAHFFAVPIWRNQLDLEDVLRYESDLIDLFCSQLARLNDVVLFDCGADIGIFSSRVCSRSETVSRVIAFEPNREAFSFLEKNMAMLRIRAHAVPSAVADFVGRGTLQTPDYDQDYTARFLVPGDGPIEVTTIDAVGIRGPAVALKIDVEGKELEVLKGAVETIRASKGCVIAIEAHPLVTRRIDRDPNECLRLLESIRPFQFTLAETGAGLTTEKPVVTWAHDRERNIVCTTY